MTAMFSMPPGPTLSFIWVANIENELEYCPSEM